MSKPRGQKAPRRFLVVAVSNSRPPDRAVCWLFTAGGLVRGFGFFIAVLIAAAFLLVDAGRADECPKDTGAAVESARTALKANDSEQDRHALECLIKAVATLNLRLAGLSDGTIPFDGQIYIPKGFVIVKPPAKGAE